MICSAVEVTGTVTFVIRAKRVAELVWMSIWTLRYGRRKEPGVCQISPVPRVVMLPLFVIFEEGDRGIEEVFLVEIASV